MVVIKLSLQEIMVLARTYIYIYGIVLAIAYSNDFLLSLLKVKIDIAIYGSKLLNNFNYMVHNEDKFKNVLAIAKIENIR